MNKLSENKPVTGNSASAKESRVSDNEGEVCSKRMPKKQLPSLKEGKGSSSCMTRYILVFEKLVDPFELKNNLSDPSVSYYLAFHLNVGLTFSPKVLQSFLKAILQQ